LAISFAAGGASKREFIVGDPEGERWRILKIYCLHQLYHAKSNPFFSIFFSPSYLSEIFFFSFQSYPRSPYWSTIFTILIMIIIIKIIHSNTIHQRREALLQITNIMLLLLLLLYVYRVSELYIYGTHRTGRLK